MELPASGSEAVRSQKKLDLPPAILHQLFLLMSTPRDESEHYLPEIKILRSLLAACSLVNRSWNTVATPLLYRHIALSTHNKQLEATFLNSPERRGLLRSVSSIHPIPWSWHQPHSFPFLTHLRIVNVSGLGESGLLDIQYSCPCLEELVLSLPPRSTLSDDDRNPQIILPPTLTLLQVDATSTSYPPQLLVTSLLRLQFLCLELTLGREDEVANVVDSPLKPFLVQLAPNSRTLQLTISDDLRRRLPLVQGFGQPSPAGLARLKNLQLEGVDLEDLMRTSALPNLRSLSVKSDRSDTNEVVRIVEEGLDRARLPKLERLWLSSERFNLLEPSLSPEVTPSWSSLRDAGVEVVDRLGRSVRDIQERVRSEIGLASRLPNEIYYIIIGLIAEDPKAPLYFSPPNGARDVSSRAVAAATDFLARAALICHVWKDIATPLLYRHVHPLAAGKLEGALELHPYLADRIRRISSRFDLTFLGRVLRSNTVVFPSLVRFETLYLPLQLLYGPYLSLPTTFPNLQNLSIFLQHAGWFTPGGQSLLLPPSLVSLSIHADWDWPWHLLLENDFPRLTSLTLHIFITSNRPYPSLETFISPSTAQQLSSLRISLWKDSRRAHFHLRHSEMLEDSPNLRSLSVSGVDLEWILQESSLPGLERIEIFHTPFPRITGAGTMEREASFGWLAEDVGDEKKAETAYETVDTSIPSNLYHLLDRTRLPNLRTLAVASLDFELEEHRLGALAARHAFEMGKLGITMVDRSGIGFGEMREGWTWGKWVEKMDGEQEEEAEGEGGEDVAAGSE